MKPPEARTLRARRNGHGGAPPRDTDPGDGAWVSTGEHGRHPDRGERSRARSSSGKSPRCSGSGRVARVGPWGRDVMICYTTERTNHRPEKHDRSDIERPERASRTLGEISAILCCQRYGPTLPGW